MNTSHFIENAPPVYKWNIATASKPLGQDGFKKLVALATDSAKEGSIDLIGYVVVPGYGCWNHGIMLRGSSLDGQARFIDAVNVVFNGKAGRTSDSDPALSEGQFEFKEE